jgi:predicted AlkP superfamily pyrophosphatase or phosphodiesterase
MRLSRHTSTARGIGVFACLAVLACSALGAVQQPAAPLTGSGGVNRPEHRDKPHVVLVSFDGFRADYLDRFDLPNFRRVQQRGARARGMTPVFPSLTFPNHYSLVTGLNPDRHGIVANSFLDPVRGARYALSDSRAVSDGTWYGGEPIWVTAESQGMVAACFFWPGSEAAIRGVRPTLWKPFEKNLPNDMRVNTVLEWLQLPADRRPHLITLYFSELDTASHDAPLDSPGVEAAARSLDRSLGVLLDGIDALPIRDRVHLLLTSDHGMVETGASQRIQLASLVDVSGIKVGFDGPVASLHVAGGAGRARQLRDAINAKLQHGRAYLREELPEPYHYRSNPRAGDVVVVMEESWTLAASGRNTRDSQRWGMHGWDPALQSMRALFLLSGPGIRAGATTSEVRNIDVYPLLTELLGLRPAAGVDGRAGAIRELLR